MFAFPRWAVVPVLVGVLALPDVADPEPALAGSHRLPNILVIMTDDQRLDTLSVMPKTLGWLKQKGTTFTNAFVTTPLCCPSRATLFTGRYAHNHEVRTNRDAERMVQASTIQRYLRRNGYLTAIAGKYLNQWPLKQDPPHFDRWAIQKHGYFNARFNVNGRLRTVKKYSTDFVRARAIRFLRWFERRDARPWLLFVTPFAAHGPFEPAPRHADAAVPDWEGNPAVFEEDRTDKPPWVQERSMSLQRALELRQKQLRTLMAVDDLVGRLMRELQRLGEARRTLVIFTSDNGYFWGEHGLGEKRLPYLQALRVPLIVRWPGRVTRGAVDDRFVANVDLAATIMDAARIAPRPRFPLDGRSLLGPNVRDRVLSEYWVDPGAPGTPTWAALTTADLQYTEYYGENGEVIFREYYDVASDPWQLENLLGDGDPENDPSPEVLERLTAQLARDRLCRGTGGEAGCP